MIRLHITAQGDCRVENISTSCGEIKSGYPGFKLGADLFVLGDVSHGKASPNEDVANSQIETECRLEYPLLAKEGACRYADYKMNELFEQGLTLIVWGSEITVNTHESRLQDALMNVEGFLSEIGHLDDLKGPHRHCMQVQEGRKTCAQH